MKLSEFQNKLNEIKDAFGDIEVVVSDGYEVFEDITIEIEHFAIDEPRIKLY